MNKNRIYCFGFTLSNLALLVLCCVIAATSLTGCSQKEVKSTFKMAQTNTIASGIVSENDKFIISWDDTAKCVVFTEKETGKKWSNLSYDAYLAGSTNSNLNSGLHITVANTGTLKWENVYSYDAIFSDGAITTEKIDNGIKVTYYFNNFKISIPVEYTIRHDSFVTSIKGKEICEGDPQYVLVSANIAPYMCSVSNEVKDAYLFVPSGTGALISNRTLPEGTRTWSGEVYAPDKAAQNFRNYTKPEQVYLPVYGVKDGNSALLAIVEKGEESAVINANAGHARNKYSSVSASINFRSSDNFFFKSNATGNTVLTRTTEKISKKEATVAFYPLSGENADFNGMADRYQKYLIDEKNLKKSEYDASSLSLTLYGGTKISKSFLGVPYSKLVALTDFSEALKMVKYVAESTKLLPEVRLMYFGDEGLNPGQIVGGKSFASEYGSKSDFMALNDYCKKIGKELFVDFETVYFSKSGAGFSKSSNATISPMNGKAKLNNLTPQRIFDDKFEYYLVARRDINKAFDAAVKKAEKYDINALSLASLTSVAYSDYSDEKYYAKSGITKQVESIIDEANKKGYKIAASGANGYAAILADIIFDSSTSSGDYYAFYKTVPFYQLVFSGYKPMYTTAINESDNYNKELALAASTGMGIGFTLVDELMIDSDDVDLKKLYALDFEGNKKLIEDVMFKKGYAALYEKLCKSSLARYSFVNDSVAMSEFSNGIVIYSNITSYSAESPVGKLAAYEYKVVEKE